MPKQGSSLVLTKGHTAGNLNHLCTQVLAPASQPHTASLTLTGFSRQAPHLSTASLSGPVSAISAAYVHTHTQSNSTSPSSPLPYHSEGYKKVKALFTPSPQGWGVLIFLTLIDSSKLHVTITQGPLRTPSTLGLVERDF